MLILTSSPKLNVSTIQLIFEIGFRSSQMTKFQRLGHYVNNLIFAMTINQLYIPTSSKFMKKMKFEIYVFGATMTCRIF